MAKKITAYIKLQLPAGQSDAAAAGGTRTGSAWRKHLGFYEGIQ